MRFGCNSCLGQAFLSLTFLPREKDEANNFFAEMTYKDFAVAIDLAAQRLSEAIDSCRPNQREKKYENRTGFEPKTCNSLQQEVEHQTMV